MREIKEISDKIGEELRFAEKYAKCAVEKKEKDAPLADVYYRLANERIADINLLHGQVVAKIDAYKQEKGEVPAHMQILYDILHKNHIDDMSMVKGILALYKEM